MGRCNSFLLMGEDPDEGIEAVQPKVMRRVVIRATCIIVDYRIGICN